MHFIVGVLLAVMDTEEAFWCFCSIIESQLQADWQAHVGDHHPQQDKKCLLRIHSFRLWYILYICSYISTFASVFSRSWASG